MTSIALPLSAPVFQAAVPWLAGSIADRLMRTCFAEARTDARERMTSRVHLLKDIGIERVSLDRAVNREEI